MVCRDGTFYELVPDDVRKQGPWQGQHRGVIEKLKPDYRLALARDGYAQLLTIPPNVTYVDQLRAAVADARHEGRGLWSSCAASG